MTHPDSAFLQMTLASTAVFAAHLAPRRPARWRGLFWSMALQFTLGAIYQLAWFLKSPT